MKQTRLVTLDSMFSLRSNEGKMPTAVGRAVPYNSWSKPIYGCYLEKFRSGAFADHLGTNPDVYASVEHDHRQLLGRTSSKTLRLKDGAEGLDIECDLPDTSAGRDVAELLKRGDMHGMSFIFETVEDQWGTEDSMRCVEIRSAKLYEVTFTLNPYYGDTTAGMRSVGEMPAGLIPHDNSIMYAKQWLLENS